MDDNAQLEKVLDLLAMSDNRESLSAILHRFLCPVISKLANPASRDKALQVLSHIQKVRSDLPLPTKALVTLYTSSTNSLVCHVSLTYLSAAFASSSKEDIISLGPLLLSTLHTRPQAQSDSILHMLILSLGALPKTMRLDDRSFAIIADFARQTLLAHPPKSSGIEVPPPGLSVAGYKRALRVQPTKPSGDVNDLTDRKVSLVKFLSHYPKAVSLLAMAASFQNGDQVASLAEDGIRRIGVLPDIDPSSVFALFTPVTSIWAPEQAHLHQVVVRKILCHSNLAANDPTNALNVIRRCLPSPLRGLRSAAMNFCHFVMTQSTDASFDHISHPLLKLFLSLVGETEADPSVSELRIFALNSLATLANRQPVLLSNNIEVLRLLFTLVRDDPLQDIRIAAQETIGHIRSCFSSPSPAVYDAMIPLLESTMVGASPQARFSALSFANRVLPFNDVSARWLCLSHVDDSAVKVREEALAGIQPIAGSIWPSFDALIQMAASPVISPSSHKRPRKGLTDTVLTHLLRFLLNALHHQSDELSAFVLEHMTEAEKSLTGDVSLNDALKAEGGSTIHSFRLLIEQGLAKSDKDAQIVACQCVCDIGSCHPGWCGALYGNRIDWLEDKLHSSDATVRIYYAALLGVATWDIPTDNLVRLLDRLAAGVAPTCAIDAVHGATVALGAVMRTALLLRSKETAPQIAAGLSALLTLLDHDRRDVFQAACVSITLAGAAGPLPVSTDAIVSKLLSHLESPRLGDHEIVVDALGALCIGEPDGHPQRDQILQGLLKTVALRGDPESAAVVHLAVGRALSTVGGWLLPMNNSPGGDGPDYRLLRDATRMKMTSSTGRLSGSPMLMDTIVDSICLLMEQDDSSATRLAVSAWCLAIITNASAHPTIQNRSSTFQAILQALLGEANDLTQEMASKGLASMYESFDQARRSQLVASFVSAFNSDQRSSSQGASKVISGDAALFNEGQVKIKSSGASTSRSLTTYRELCSLASDAGSPDLVFRLMDIASMNRMWMTRAGFAYSVVSAGLDIPDIAVLIPRLFRFQFDPDPRVRSAMSSVWKTLVPNPRAAVTDNLSAILTSITQGITDPVWRTREGSCLALVEAIAGRRWSAVSAQLIPAWASVLRAMDDVKESVREAAAVAGRALVGLALRLCDPLQTAEAKDALSIIIPFMLDKGLGPSRDELRKWSLTVIRKLANVAGTALRPHIALIAPALLEGLSVLESQELNMMQRMAEGMDSDVANALEQGRSAASRHGGAADILDICARTITADQLGDLMPGLVEQITSGVGLPTLTGSAGFVVALCAQIGPELRPHGRSLLKALRVGLRDRSSTVRQSMAVAASHVSRFASQKQVGYLIADMVKLFGESDETSRSTSLLVLGALSKTASSALAPHHSEVLPLCLVSAHSKNKSIAEGARQIWDDNVGDNASAMVLWAPEIVKMTCNWLDTSGLWELRQQSACALAELARDGRSAVVPHTARIIKSLVSAIGGRRWDGKEAVVDALVALFESAPESAKEAAPSELIDVLITQCKRPGDLVFRKGVLEALGVVAQIASVPEAFGIVSEVAISAISIGGDEEVVRGRGSEADEIAADQRRERRQMQDAVAVAGWHCLGKAWPIADEAVQEIHLEKCWSLAVECVMRGSSVLRRAAGLKALELIGMSCSQSGVLDEKRAGELMRLMSMGSDDKRSEVREVAGEIAASVARALQDGGQKADIWRGHGETVRAVLERLKGDGSRAVRRVAGDAPKGWQ